MTKVLTVAEWQRPAPRTPGQHRRLTRLQAKAEQAVERLLALLDEIAGDPDLEDNGDEEDGGDNEFSLGLPEQMNQEWARKHPGEGNDLEAGDEKEGDDLDRREASDLEVNGEGDGLDHSEGGESPSAEYRERLRQRRGERSGRAAS